MMRVLCPLLVLLALALGPAARAADPQTGRTLQPEEDDFSTTPFTEYGEFNHQEAEEEEDTKFFQYGRFFGLSIGFGTQGVTGNRGQLWSGGFPMVEFKLHYWFDFNLAMALAVYTATHNYDDPISNDHHDVNLTHLGFELKYYFDTKNMSAAISFANPYIAGGIGTYSKTDNDASTGGDPDRDTSIGFSAGAGLEFVMSPRKVYFETEAMIHLMTFKDTSTGLYNSAGIPDLTGLFFTIGAHILFTF